MKSFFDELSSDIREVRETISGLNAKVSRLESRIASIPGLTLDQLVSGLVRVPQSQSAAPVSTPKNETITAGSNIRPAGRGTNEAMLKALGSFPMGASKEQICEFFQTEFGLVLTFDQASSSVDYLKRMGKVESIRMGKSALYRLK